MNADITCVICVYLIFIADSIVYLVASTMMEDRSTKETFKNMFITRLWSCALFVVLFGLLHSVIKG